MIYFTGVGSRSTPMAVCEKMTALGPILERRGYRLRTGDAAGADAAFAAGFSPERVSCFGISSRQKPGVICPKLVLSPDSYRKMESLARSLHPAWGRCGPLARELHTRNMAQVLGLNLDEPSRFLLCWTPDGAESASKPTSRATGGTGQAIRCALLHDIPVINMQNAGWNNRLLDLLRSS